MAEMAREAVDRCLAARGLTFEEIDAVVAGNMEMFEGIYLVDQFFVDALGALGKPLFKLNTGGTVGAERRGRLLAPGRLGAAPDGARRSASRSSPTARPRPRLRRSATRSGNGR